MYARIEAINPDIKKEWYQVTLLLLTIPSQQVTWILREEYINGVPFTMGGNPMMLKGVEKTHVQEIHHEKGRPETPESPEKQGKVIPFKSNLKKSE